MDKPRPHFGQRVVINQTAPFFQGEEAVVAYIGDTGVSVYLASGTFHDCIPLKDGEYD